MRFSNPWRTGAWPHAHNQNRVFFVALFQVRQISEDPPCKCPVKFCIEKQPKGHYRVGDKVLYVRVCNALSTAD